MGFVSGHVTNVFYGLSWAVLPCFSSFNFQEQLCNLLGSRLRTSAQRARTGSLLNRETGCTHFYHPLSCLSEGLPPPPGPTSSMKASAPYLHSLQNHTPFSFLLKLLSCSATLGRKMIWLSSYYGWMAELANRFIYFPRGTFFFNEYTWSQKFKWQHFRHSHAFQMLGQMWDSPEAV